MRYSNTQNPQAPGEFKAHNLLWLIAAGIGVECLNFYVQVGLWDMRIKNNTIVRIFIVKHMI